MIVERVWRGVANIDTAEQYIAHLKSDTFPKVKAIPGNLDAKILRRDLGEQIEFVIITSWTSIEAIKSFAGENIETAVVPKAAQAVLAEYDEIVRHYEVVS